MYPIHIFNRILTGHIPATFYNQIRTFQQSQVYSDWIVSDLWLISDYYKIMITKWLLSDCHKQITIHSQVLPMKNDILEWICKSSKLSMPISNGIGGL